MSRTCRECNTICFDDPAWINHRCALAELNQDARRRRNAFEEEVRILRESAAKRDLEREGIYEETYEEEVEDDGTA